MVFGRAEEGVGGEHPAPATQAALYARLALQVRLQRELFIDNLLVRFQ